MRNSLTYLLLGTAVATAVFHTLIPDHWLPFVLAGRARGWPARTTAAIAGLSATIHAALSVGLGLLAVGIGVEAARALGETLEHASAFLLIGFGVVYALWSWRKGGHFHPGGHLIHHRHEGRGCDGDEGPSHPEHLHYHADVGWIEGAGSRSALSLAVIVGVNPCILILPIMLATVEQGAAAVILVTSAYCVTTVVLMVGLSALGVTAAYRLFRPPGFSRYMEMVSGVLIAVTGVVFLLLGH